MKIQAFFRQFPAESECQTYLYNLRWPNGCKCPYCKNEKAYLADDGTVECCSCSYKMSLKGGTVLEGSRLSLQTWFYAIWYASSVAHPGKIKVKTYQENDGIKSNRPALSVKHAIDFALLNRLEFDRLKGYVEIAIAPFKIRGTTLYLITAGEILNRKVLRIWAEVCTEKPREIYWFVKKYIARGTVLNFCLGIADESTLRSMGFACGSHRHDYRCKTIENESNYLISELQESKKLSEAQKTLLRICAVRNSLYTPISFEDLLKRVVALPPGVTKNSQYRITALARKKTKHRKRDNYEGIKNLENYRKHNSISEKTCNG